MGRSVTRPLLNILKYTTLFQKLRAKLRAINLHMKFSCLTWNTVKRLKYVYDQVKFHVNFY